MERIVGLLRGSPSLFQCDTLSRLVADVEKITHRKLGQNEDDDVALRLIADHCRSMTFLIADGVIPSNEDRGYVLRRIIRRAIRFAYLLGAETRVTPLMADRVIGVMGDVYPEIVASRDLIVRILDREEEQFSRTLQTGLAILETELAKLPEDGAVLPGDVAFTLHDTYGFPLEVTIEIVADRGVSVTSTRSRGSWPISGHGDARRKSAPAWTASTMSTTSSSKPLARPSSLGAPSTCRMRT